MAKYNNQKAKILFLQQMLYETGEGHTISMQNILDSLQEKGIRAERKSIYDDMEVLRFFGMDIRYQRERPSGYYLADAGEMKRPALIPESLTAAEPAPSAQQAQEETAAEGESARKGPEPQNGEKAPDTKPDKGSDYYPEKSPDYVSWMEPEKGDRKKQMKLLCSEKGRKMARSYFGDSADIKRREDDSYVITAPLMEGSRFFGWLTASGGEIRVLKPKKTAQAYRDFLKTLMKDYK